MSNKQHHDLLFNNKLHTINILNLAISRLKSTDSIHNRYICNLLFDIIGNKPFKLMLGSLQENYTTVNRFIDVWYFKIYQNKPIKNESGIFGIINEVNTNTRIEFLKQILKQLNKPFKT